MRILIGGVPPCFGCIAINKLHDCVYCEFVERCFEENKRLNQLRKEFFAKAFTEGK